MEKYILPELEYSYDALEPYFDQETLKIHHDRHHQTYVTNLNKALEKYPDIHQDIYDILLETEQIPKDIKEDVTFNGGGHLNHSFFWKLLKKNVKLPTIISEIIKKDFETVENFKVEFKKAAMSIKGSGWTWLVIENGKIKILITSNHDNPISEGYEPILVLDMWEHAYYLKYKNNKNEYIDAFFNIINWEQVEKNYLNATSKRR